jgi:hypothetical protein
MTTRTHRRLVKSVDAWRARAATDIKEVSHDWNFVVPLCESLFDITSKEKKPGYVDIVSGAQVRDDLARRCDR